MRKKKDDTTILLVGAAVAAGLFFLMKQPTLLQRSAALPLQPAQPGPTASAMPINQVIQSVIGPSTTIRNLPNTLPTQAPTIDIVSSPPIDYQMYSSI